MERKEDIKLKVDKVLESVKSVKPVDTPVFFTDKTVTRLRAVPLKRMAFSYSGLLKIAAILILLVVNVYTIKYVLNPNQQNLPLTDSNNANISDLVNEYQPNDSNELTFEENINR